MCSGGLDYHDVCFLYCGGTRKGGTGILLKQAGKKHVLYRSCLLVLRVKACERTGDCHVGV